MKLSEMKLTHMGRVRTENQDAIFSFPKVGVFLVADGMGGERAGAEAAAQVVSSVERVAREFFISQKPKSPKDIESLARHALEQASKEVLDIAAREPEKTGMGSTGSLLVLYRGVFVVAQVGDSRVYLVRNGNVRQITRDQTVVWTLYENGILTRDQLETHPDRHLLTQCIGGVKPVEVDIFEDKAQAGDLFLICSDGLTGYAGENEVTKLLVDPVYTLEERAYRMLQAALDGGGGDNVSIVLIRVESLDPEDTWEPIIPALPEGAKPLDPQEMIRPEPEEVELPSRKGLYWAGILITAAVITAMVVFALKFQTVTMEAILDTPLEITKEEIAVLDGARVPVADAVLSVEENHLTLSLPRHGRYFLLIKAPGILADEASVLEPAAYAGEPVHIQLNPSAQLTIDFPEDEEIATVEISRIRVANPEVIYHFPNKGEETPKLEFDLLPDTLHTLVVTNKAGKEFRQDFRITGGNKQVVPVEF